MDKQIKQLTNDNQNIKSNCKKQFECKKYWMNRCSMISEKAIDYITDEENIWKFCKVIGFTLKGKCYTYIEPYTNKKGITSDAHHTYYGKWCGSVKAKGNKPFITDCLMPVSNETFTFDNTKIGNDRFIPIAYNGKRKSILLDN